MTPMTSIKNDRNVLYRYYKDRKGRAKGVVMAVLDTANIVRYGWSMVNFKAGDEFDRDGALERAYGRAVSARDSVMKGVPMSLKQTFEQVIRDAHDCIRFSQAAAFMDELVQLEYNNGSSGTQEVRITIKGLNQREADRVLEDFYNYAAAVGLRQFKARAGKSSSSNSDVMIGNIGPVTTQVGGVAVNPPCLSLT